MQARNDEEVKAMIIPGLRDVVDYVVQKIWNDNREIVREVVYEAYGPSEYSRTNEFKEAWDTKVSSSGASVRGEFKYEPNMLSSGGFGQHSSLLDGSAMKEGLAEVIYQGLAGDFTGEYKYAYQNPRFSGQAWTGRRDAWAKLKKELGKRKLKSYFVAGLRANGIKFKDRKATLTMREFDEK